MKFIFLTLISIISLSSYSADLKFKIQKPGSYLITMKQFAPCTQRNFSVTPFEVGFNETGEYIKMSVAPISNTSIGLAVCREGFNSALGVVKVLNETNLEINTDNAGRFLDQATVEIKLIKLSKLEKDFTF